ncbi:hypothetical protein LINPERHAP1_LOCUS30545 [Linum perenne]
MWYIAKCIMSSCLSFSVMHQRSFKLCLARKHWRVHSFDG